MIDSFENDHFSKLDNQTKIIENAKTTAEEAIIFSYNSFGIRDITLKNENVRISGFTYETRNYFFNVINEGTDKFINYPDK